MESIYLSAFFYASTESDKFFFLARAERLLLLINEPSRRSSRVSVPIHEPLYLWLILLNIIWLSSGLGVLEETLS